MQVNFYQLSRDPVKKVIPLLVAKALEGGGKLLVVSGDPAQRAALSEALWAREGSFLANGEAGAPHASRQPVLLSDDCDASNEARVAIIADGHWRGNAAGLGRAILLFSPEQTEAARELWSALSGSGHDLRIFKQGEAGGWREGH